MKKLFCRLLAAGTAVIVATACAPESEVRIVVPAGANTPMPIALEAFVYRPEGAGKHPVVIFSHGSSGGDPKRSLPSAEQAKFFVERGFIVIAPMRRGRGRSEGVSLEGEERNCDVTSWTSGLLAANDDITAAIDYAATLPEATATRILLAGGSRGGFLSVAYAATGERRAAVVGVVNFVGGWVAQAEDNCPTDFNEVAFEGFGASSDVPQLWLYGDNDAFYTRDSILNYARAFESAGGKLDFRLIADVPENGHRLPDFPDLWQAHVDRYLKAIGLDATETSHRTESKDAAASASATNFAWTWGSAYAG